MLVLAIHLNLKLELTKSLFNASSNYDLLVFSLIIIAILLAIWLLFFYVNMLLNYNNNSTLTNKETKLNNELFALIVLLLISLGGLAITANYLILFVAIELQSLVLYIVLATNINFNSNSRLITIWGVVSKVSLSYLINAAMVTALLLFGIAINSPILIIGSLLWKLGVIPVHSWSIPILDNQHSLITSIYLTLAKLGTILAVSYTGFNSSLTEKILVYVGILNLTLGNILGLLQIRYQRIIVYSSLIQIGYMLLILVRKTSLSVSYFELYSFFTIMLLLLWTIPIYNTINSGRLMNNSILWTLVLILYTVTGLPYFPLFWPKLDILLAVQSESVLFALISTLLSSLIYVRLIKYMTFFQYKR